MKNILAINTANSGGGAERVAFALCKELHLRGHGSRLLARRIDPIADPLVKELVIKVPGNNLLYSAGNFFDEIFSTQYLFYLPTLWVPLMKAVQDAEVVHFHNMHGHYFNLLMISRLMKAKPVVWTFHDMWPFTGKCVYSFECERYTESCGECPHLSPYPAMKRDLTRSHLKLKKFLYGKKSFVIVTPSEWLRSRVANSFLKDVPTHVIPSPVDTKQFNALPKNQAREQLRIPAGKKVLLFVASAIHLDARKGIGTFQEIVKEINHKRNDVYTIIVGELGGSSVLDSSLPGMETGWVNDPQMLRACYAAADVYVFPSLAENSPCTILEAMACGTTPVAYNVGGVSEQIIDGKTGVLIPAGDKRKMLESILFLFNHPDNNASMAGAAASRAVQMYSLDQFVEKYLNVYQEAFDLKRH